MAPSDGSPMLTADASVGLCPPRARCGRIRAGPGDADGPGAHGRNQCRLPCSRRLLCHARPSTPLLPPWAKPNYGVGETIAACWPGQASRQASRRRPVAVGRIAAALSLQRSCGPPRVGPRCLTKQGSLCGSNS